jgi:cytoskeletal protein RodZ
MAKGSSNFFKTKVAMAVIGACLIGGTSAVLAARTVNEGTVLQTSNAVTNNSNSTTASQVSTSTSTTTKSQATATSQATTGGGGGDGNQPTPTTPQSQPTARPTATSPVGQTVTLSGSVASVGTNTFALRRSGVSHTIDVNGGTTFTGAATSFGGLQTGMQVQVNCTVQADGSCLASQVSSSSDN